MMSFKIGQAGTTVERKRHIILLNPLIFLLVPLPSSSFCPSFGFSLHLLPPHVLVNSTCVLDRACTADPSTVLFMAEAVTHHQ